MIQAAEHFEQTTLFKETPWEQFERWKDLPGARHVIRDIYALAAKYVPEWQRTGIQVSIKLLFEIERHRMKHRTARAQRRGMNPTGWKGYTLNNTFTAPMARHIEEHKPEWAGMFEKRESPKKGGPKIAVIVEGRRATA